MYFLLIYSAVALLQVNITPVMYTDISEYCPFLITMAIIGLVVGGGIGLGIGLHKGHTGWDLAKDVLVGAGIGAGCEHYSSNVSGS